MRNPAPGLACSLTWIRRLRQADALFLVILSNGLARPSSDRTIRVRSADAEPRRRTDTLRNRGSLPIGARSRHRPQPRLGKSREPAEFQLRPPRNSSRLGTTGRCTRTGRHDSTVRERGQSGREAIEWVGLRLGVSPAEMRHLSKTLLGLSRRGAIRRAADPPGFSEASAFSSSIGACPMASSARLRPQFRRSQRSRRKLSSGGFQVVRCASKPCLPWLSADFRFPLIFR